MICLPNVFIDFSGTVAKFCQRTPQLNSSQVSDSSNSADTYDYVAPPAGVDAARARPAVGNNSTSKTAAAGGLHPSNHPSQKPAKQLPCDNYQVFSCAAVFCDDIYLCDDDIVNSNNCNACEVWRTASHPNRWASVRMGEGHANAEEKQNQVKLVFKRWSRRQRQDKRTYRVTNYWGPESRTQHPMTVRVLNSDSGLDERGERERGGERHGWETKLDRPRLNLRKTVGNSAWLDQ